MTQDWADREGSFEQRKEAEMNTKEPIMSAESLEASASPSRDSEVGTQMAGAGSIPDAGIPSAAAVEIAHRFLHEAIRVDKCDPHNCENYLASLIDQHTKDLLVANQDLRNIISMEIFHRATAQKECEDLRAEIDKLKELLRIEEDDNERNCSEKEKLRAQLAEKDAIAERMRQTWAVIVENATESASQSAKDAIAVTEKYDELLAHAKAMKKALEGNMEHSRYLSAVAHYEGAMAIKAFDDYVRGK